MRVQETNIAESGVERAGQPVAALLLSPRFISGTDILDPATLPVKAAAVSFPNPRQQGGPSMILPPFGTSMGNIQVPWDVPQNSDEVYYQRIVGSDPRELWYLALPSKLLPKQVEMIKRSGLGGDLWQQWQLFALMADSWPMFRKCIHEICSEVSATKFAVQAYHEEGEEPTKSAQEKAACVRRAMTSMAGDPWTTERGFAGMVYDFCDAMSNGMSLVELMWEQANGDKLPRSSAWVHPRNYTWTSGGRVQIFSTDYSRMQFTGQVPINDPPPGKFILAQFQSKSGSSLACGLMRPLALFWSYWMFALEWSASGAQVWGQPFLHCAYGKGANDAEINAIYNRLMKAGSSNCMLYPEGSVLNVVPAQPMGTDNRCRVLMDEADKACQILILGQTATTSPTPGKLGKEDTHEKVKRGNVEGVAKWVAREPLNQFARAIVLLNWGEADEVPTVEADYTEAETPDKGILRVQGAVAAELPLLLEEAYAVSGFKMPQEGELVFAGGKVGKLVNTTSDIDANAPPAPPPGLQDEGKQAEHNLNRDAMQAREPVNVRSVLARASEADLRALEALVIKAEECAKDGVLNGEYEEIQTRIRGLQPSNQRIVFT